MTKHFIAVLLFTFQAIILSGQTNQINIPFLETMPEIDGLPEKEPNALEWRDFSYIEKTSDQNNDIGVHYMIGYNYNYLYLLIAADTDSIIYRDRAYQNGDGFHLVIAKPDSGNSTAEFYVLRFSPANKTKNQPARKGVWYYNIGLSGRGLGAATQFECRPANGKSYFELLLPWNDVYPYHPLFSDSIGFNLCFVKALGDKEKNFYFMKYDQKIQWEQNKRTYLPVKFETPDSITTSCSLAHLQKKNNKAGDALKIRVVSFSPSSNHASYYFTIRSADNYVYSDLYKAVALPKGMNTNEFGLPVEKLAPGGYKVVWKCSDNSEGEIPLTILPEINETNEKAVLEKVKSKISTGDYNTMLFMLQNIANEYKNVKAYETAGNIRESYLTFLKLSDDLKSNGRLPDKNGGVARRAFLSGIDQTLQPYSIKLPDGFDRNTKYPLYVMLHGSGSDDQEMLKGNLTENNFIEIAPFGRGTSNCFTTDGAEVDVKEAIDDAIRNYPVDTTKIIIAGFSMGGYGAYRILYQYPRLFKGVVVFSGHPNLASKWMGEGFPDFLMEKYLVPFKNVPVFIYHSKNDLNCPYDLTRQLVEKLKQAGARAEFVTTEEGGHGIIDADDLPAYYVWLKNTIEK